MKPEFIAGNVRANCPGCGAVASFEYIVQSRELGAVMIHAKDGSYFHTRRQAYTDAIYHLLRCASCGRGALANVLTNNENYLDGELVAFWPPNVEMLDIPTNVPPDVRAEFREAELCACVGAWRGGSSLLRSTLEKTLRANGYEKGSLAERIDKAAADGALRRRGRGAHMKTSAS